MTEIRFEQVSKSFGKAEVVKPLDLVIKSGEFFTFVGPSGCGKSTLLNLIAGLEPLTAGSILFDGAAVNDISPRDRDVAMVFQSYALYPHMTVFGNLAFPLEMKKERKDAIESEVRRVAGLLGLEELLSRRPKELSGGQRQRVALGRAIIRKPRVFLMDEPLSNLDAALRMDMRAELKLLHRQLGITTIYVTHDQSEAMGLSDRIAVLNKGELQQVGRPADVYRYPANIFVGGFIGSPPMNFLECAVRSGAPLDLECPGLVLPGMGTGRPRSGIVQIGIRPEDAVVGREKREGSAAVSVSVIEPAGAITWAEALWKGAKVRAMVAPGEDLRHGDTAYLTFTREKASLFDAVSGKRL